MILMKKNLHSIIFLAVKKERKRVIVCVGGGGGGGQCTAIWTNHFKDITINIPTADPADNYHLKTSFTGASSYRCSVCVCVFRKPASGGR